MCDYSLHNVATRPAKVGDKLVSTHFPNSLTRGFAAVGEPNVAVCLPPGTELAFEADVRCDAVIGLLPTKKLTENVARFRYVENGYPYAHRDALEFPSGKIVLLCAKASMRPCFSCRSIRTPSTCLKQRRSGPSRSRSNPPPPTGSAYCGERRSDGSSEECVSTTHAWSVIR